MCVSRVGCFVMLGSITGGGNISCCSRACVLFLFPFLCFRPEGIVRSSEKSHQGYCSSYCSSYCCGYCEIRVALKSCVFVDWSKSPMIISTKIGPNTSCGTIPTSVFNMTGSLSLICVATVHTYRYLVCIY